jgi:type IV pilus assembly protein PilF
VIKKLACLLVIFLIAACQTSRETTISSSNRASVSSGKFEKKESAVKRAEIGLTYLGQGVLDRAKFHLDRALQYDDELGDVHYGLAIYYQRVKEKDLSRQHFEKSLRIESKNPNYLNAYGAFLCEIDEFEQADKMFQRAIDIPTYSEVSKTFYNVGLCALKQNDSDKAQANFRNALNRNPNMAGALIGMAQIEFDKERYERAMSYIKRFENNSRVTAESSWLGLRVAHFIRDKDAIARYSLILEQRFPDSHETSAYLDNKKRWM